jgi:hypothetical protein
MVPRDHYRLLLHTYELIVHLSIYSTVQLSWDSWPYFTVSGSRLPFSSPPTTRRVTVEVFDPAYIPTVFKITPWHGPRRKHSPSIVVQACADHIYNTVLLLLRECMLRALPCKDRCLRSHCLATGLYATILIYNVTPQWWKYVIIRLLSAQSDSARTPNFGSTNMGILLWWCLGICIDLYKGELIIYIKYTTKEGSSLLANNM